MASTLLDHRAMLAELHINDLLREAEAARRMQAATVDPTDDCKFWYGNESDQTTSVLG